MTVPGAPRLVRLALHVRGLWPGPGLWFPLVFMAWALGCLVAGRGRWEHGLFLFVIPMLAYTSVATRRLYTGLLPIGILGLLYDAMRWVQNVGLSEDRVHLCDLRALDMRLASAEVSGARGSVHDWVQQHPALPLDLVSAVPYGTFIFLIFAFAVYLYVKDYERLRLFGWTFLLVNLAGFATYHLYPAAPPWYFHAHGCTVDLTARASEGPNLARVDAWLGVPFFRSFYGRSSDVFGAVPSLHVTYPGLVVFFGWSVFRWPLRLASITFLLTMCFAAVYLDHHWIIDVVLGLAYAVAAYAAAVMVARLRDARRGEAPPLAPEASP